MPVSSAQAVGRLLKSMDRPMSASWYSRLNDASMTADHAVCASVRAMMGRHKEMSFQLEWIRASARCLVASTVCATPVTIMNGIELLKSKERRYLVGDFRLSQEIGPPSSLIIKM